MRYALDEDGNPTDTPVDCDLADWDALHGGPPARKGTSAIPGAIKTPAEARDWIAAHPRKAPPMLTYTPDEIARGRARAIREGLRIRATPDPLRYRTTSSKDAAGPYVYDQRVSDDLMSVECSCIARTACDHGAMALCAARLAAMKQAARTLRRGQIWKQQLAAVVT